ncbi:threonine/serine ThrE exporter family protein [Propionibacteriaceae bacterium G1746]
MTEAHFPDERALEPRQLISASNLVLRAGNLMLGAGTSSLRVRQSMQRVARSLGVDHLQAQITFTTIVVTIHRGGLFRTQAGEITTPGVDADRIRAIQHLTRRLPEHQTPDDIAAALDAIEARTPLHRSWLVTLAVGLACASVAFLNGAGAREVLSALLAATGAFVVHRFLLRRHLNLFGCVVISTVAASTIYAALAFLLHGGELLSTPKLLAGFVAASVFLVPGFPLFTGGLDLARLDLQAGVGRMVYAVVVMLSIGVGIWTVASVTGLQPTDPPPALGEPAVLWSLRVVASFFAVLGWALMFNSPWREALGSSIVAIAGSVARLVLVDAGAMSHVATFVGALVMGSLCHIVARRLGLTRLIMLVPTLLVMIPGAPALQALLHFNNGDLFGFMSNGIFVVLQVITMICGLVASMMIFDPAWAFTHRDRQPARP